MAALALAASGCGDNTATNPGSDTLFDPDASFPDTLGDAVGTDTTPTDTSPADTVADTTPTDTQVIDLVPDLEAPFVASTSPADGQNNVGIPFTVTITFSEAIYKPTIASQTVKLIDFNGVEIPGTPVLGEDQKTVTWTPTNSTQQYASPYTIKVLGNIITDLAGNKLVSDQLFTFTTANFPDQDGYRDLAAKYAPVIYSAVTGGTAPYAQVPTKLDSDGNWDLSNNKDWLTQTATSLIPAVYYNVTETRTHYFINYLLYFPWVNHSSSGYAHGNGTNGYLVTVEKTRGEQAERPITLHSYWRENQAEENQAFVTTESGIIAAGLGASDWSVHKEYAQAELFADGRFKAYVTAQTHRACLWGWNQTGGLSPCEWPNEVQNGNKLVFAYKGGSPTPYQKVGGAWPKDMSEITGTPESLGYALIPALSSLWPRRFEAGPNELFQVGSTFTYQPDTGHTVGAGLKLTTKFLDPVGADASAYGRPMWSWGWSPAVGSGADITFSRVTRGEMAIDPAWYVWERHTSSLHENGLATYNETDGSGFSTDYCFNGFANIDVRVTDAHCH